MDGNIERLLSSWFAPGTRLGPLSWSPPVDVYRTATGWLLKYELAGISPGDLQLRVNDDTLTLEGMRRDMRVAEGQRSYSMEISYNRFERTVRLPCCLNEMEITTDYRDGMLVVRLSGKEPRHDDP